MAKFILLILCNSLLLFSSHAQCPDEKFLCSRLDFAYKSKLSTKDELKSLLQYRESMKDCPYRNDSTHVLLLRRIAWMYSNLGDHLKAIEYEQEALQIIRSSMGKPNIVPGDIIAIYLLLSKSYDSLNDVRKKQAALDSCISIGIRLKLYSKYFILALNKIVQFNYDIGDYHRCIENAIVCEKLAAQYINHTDPSDRDFGKENS
jgi:tetratricopeptide (TPR) repeat protein